MNLFLFETFFRMIMYIFWNVYLEKKIVHIVCYHRESSLNISEEGIFFSYLFNKKKNEKKFLHEFKKKKL